MRTRRHLSARLRRAGGRRLRLGAATVVALVVVGVVALAQLPGAAPRDPHTTAEAVHALAVSYHGTTVDHDARTGVVELLPVRRNGGLVVFVHGWRQTAASMLHRPPQRSVARALLAEGYVVVAADAHLKAWGDAASVADYRRLIAVTTRRYRLTDVFLAGESMGGLATMQLARTVPAVRAVVAWYPVCDLRTMTAARFQPSIASSWPGGDAAVSPVRVGRAPLMVWASPADTVVRARSNAARCVAEARAAGARVTLTPSRGEHGDASNFDPAAVRGFFDRYRTSAVGGALQHSSTGSRLRDGSTPSPAERALHRSGDAEARRP